MSCDNAAIAFDVISELVVSRVRRVHYVIDGRPQTEAGPVEITFADDHTVLLLDAGPDGEALAARTEAWKDPFAAPLSAENSEFVARHGKWTAFDVSEAPPYDKLTGSRVTGVIPTRTPKGKIKGVTVITERGTMRAVVEADELYVDIT